VPIFSADEVKRFRTNLEEFEAAQGHPLDGSQRAKSYLLFDWVHEMATHPNVLDAVEDLIGPNILLFYCTSWLKPAKEPAFVSWHQDSTYFGLEPEVQVTAWLALSPSTPQSGCVRVLPRTHQDGILASRTEPDPRNLLTSGQHITDELDEDSAEEIILAPGEMSLHHTNVVHGSGSNDSDDRRLGFCLSYIPTHVRQYGEYHSLAMLVRGVDEFGNFEAEAPPTGNADAASLAEHKRSVELFRANAREKGNQTGDRLDRN
jgi:hypothetical protein